MINLKSKRFRRLVSIILTIAMMVTLLPGGSSTANAENTASLEEVISNVGTSIDTVDGVKATKNENNIWKIQIADSNNKKEGFVGDIFDKILTANGSLELLKAIMTNEDGDSYIKVTNGAKIDFSKINNAENAVAVIALISGNATVTDFINAVTSSDTGVIVTLNKNIELLDELFYLETEKGAVKVSERWEALLGKTYAEASNDERKHAAADLLYEIMNSGRVNDKVEIAVKYDGKEITTVVTVESTVTIDYGNENKDTTITVVNGTTIADNQIVANEKVGYTFDKWSIDGSQVEDSYIIDGDVKLTATWTANNDTPYEVQIFEMKTDGSYDSEPVEKITDKTGTTDTNITESDITFDRTGFQLDKEKSEIGKNINGDGSTVVKAYYKRNVWKATFNAGSEAAFKETELRYEEKIIAPETEPTSEGSVFVGWFIGDDEVDFENFTMPDDNLTISAKWIAESDLYNIAEKYEIKDENIYLYKEEVVIKPNTEDGVTAIILEDNTEVPEVKKTDDGVYNFSIKFKLANGKITQSYNFSFTIDKTEPNIDSNVLAINYGEKTDIIFSNITDPLIGTTASGIQFVEIKWGGNTHISGTETSYTVKWEDLPEGEYDVEAVVKDYAGNEKTVIIPVKKDTSVPMVGNKTADINGWTNKGANIEFLDIQDGTIGTNAIGTAVSGIDSVKLEYVAGEDKTEITDYTVNDSGDTYTILWDTLQEGDYSIKAIVTDKAGNKTEATVNVKKDITKPEFDISELADRWLNSEDNQDVNVSGVKDAVSGIAEVVIQYNSVEKVYSGENITDAYTIEWEDLPEGEYDINVTVTDNAGNILSKPISIKKDTYIAFNSVPESSEITWKDRTDIVFSEIVDTTSGIANVELEYVEGESITDIPSDDYSINDSGDTYTILWESLPEGDYYVKVVVRDNAGNSKEATIKVQKDTKIPKLVSSDDIVSWTGAAKEYETNPNVIFSEIKDDVIGENAVGTAVSGIETIEIKYVSSEEARVVKDDEITKEIGENGQKYTILWEKLPEGNYDVVITVTDIAGNVVEDKVKVKKDVKKPELNKSDDITPWTTNTEDENDKNVVFSNINDLIGDNAVGTEVSKIAKVTISYVKKDIDGNQLSEEVIESHSENIQDTYTILWDKLEHGDYYVRIAVEDNAGNITKEEVRVQKDTELYFTDSSDISWENQLDVKFSDIKDEDSQIKEVELSYVEKDSDGNQISETVIDTYNENIQETYTIAWSDLPEGDYYVKAVIKDNAGNVTHNEVHVQKDIQKPVEINSSTDIAPWLNNAEGDETNPDVVFSGIKDAKIGENAVGIVVSDIETIVLKYVSEEEIREVKEDEIVIETSEEGQSYTILWEKLPEGNYSVEATVTDKAGNATTKTVEVMKDIKAPVFETSADITPWTTNAEGDETKPRVAFSGITDGVIGNNAVGTEVSKIKSIALEYVWGENRIPVRKVTINDNKDEYAIEWSELPQGNYYVEATVTDNAGNVTTDKIHVQKDIKAPVFEALTSITPWTNNAEGDELNPNVVFSGIKDDVITGEDNAVGTDVSGIESVVLKYVSEEEIREVKEDEIVIKTSEEGQSYTILWEKLPEGNYSVEATVTDKAGNATTKTVEVMKDIKAPVFETSADITPWANNAGGDGTNRDVAFSGIRDDAIGDNAVGTEVSDIESIVLKYVSTEESRVVQDGEIVKETSEYGQAYTIKWSDLPEGNYSVEATVTDIAGNVTTKEIYVQKDITAPVINKTADVTPWTNNGTDVIFSNVGDTEIGDNKVGNETSGVKEFSIKYVYEDTEGKRIETNVENYTTNEISESETAYAISWDTLPEGNYYVEMKVVDHAENNTVKQVHVKKDITNPELTVTAIGKISENSWEQIWKGPILGETVKFMNFSNTKVDVTLAYNDPEPSDKKAVNDQKSGIETVEYFVTDKSILSREELANYTNWIAVYINDGNYTDYKSKYSFIIDTTTNVNAVVYVKVNDNAGNVTYGSSNGIIVDKRNPKPEIEITIPQSEKGFYNTAVPITYSVTDPENGGAYSGLKSVKYEIINGDNANNNVTKTTEYKAENHIQTTNDQRVEINGSKFNSNNVKFRVTAVDNAGNTASKEVDLKIDTTSPKIDVSYAEAAHQGKYYRENRVATITITERNFKTDNVNIVITKDGNQSNRLANVSWTKIEGTGNKDNTKHIATITYSADGDYTFDIECTDKAGNDNSKVNYSGGNGKEFTVDKTLPIATVTYDDTPTNNKYYNSGIKATVVIKEHNFNENAVKLTTIGSSSVGRFSKTGNDTYTAVVSYMYENECQFDIEFSDMAGNAAKYNDQSGNNRNDYAMDEFVIDMTAPKDIVFATAPNSANNGTATATFDFNENYFSDSSNPINSRSGAVEISINGYKNGDVTSQFPFSLSTNSGKVDVKFGDFPREIQWDDVYTITTTVTDLAGNKTSGEIVFSVNRFGSNYVFGTSTEELVNNYYTNTQQDIEVYEISASTKYVEDYTISIIINGERRELVEGKDFTVDHNWKVEYPQDYDVNGQNNILTITGSMLKEVGASANNGWKINHYVINAENFDIEGEYTILISSTDTAGNSMASNTSKYESSKNVGFVYDKSLPEWYIRNAQDSDVYKGATYDFEIVVSDDVSSVDKVEITYDGKTVVYKAEDITDGLTIFTAEESLSTQQLEVVVTDKAGNVTKEESQIYEFRLTSNALLQFFYLYWVYLLIALLAIAAGIISFIILKKRKKEETEK